MGDSGPEVLSLVVGRDESRDGVEPDAVEKIGFTRGLLRLGDVTAAVATSSAVASLCDALRRFPKGEFLRPDIGRGDSRRSVVFLMLTRCRRDKREKVVG